MIDANGWVDWAKRIDGIADKQYAQKNSMIGIACHSVVGQEGAQDDGVPNRFLSTERAADGNYTANAAASCTFILRKSGLLIQMYPVWTSAWTSGGREANTQYVPIELEGGYQPHNEPMTPEQVQSYVRLVRDLEAFTGRKYTPGVNILQHKDLAKMFGYAPTACASDRYELGNKALMAAREPVGNWERRIAALEENVEFLRGEIAKENLQRQRLNDAVVLRGKLHQLAGDPDYARLEKAAKILKDGGINL